MPTTQEILQAVAGMQQNAQNNLPVVPNNGNPNGANNMPAGNPAAPTGPIDNTPDWVKPSPSMDAFHQMLQQPIQRANPMDNTDHWGGLLQGYAGPRPGSPEWQAARAAGQHPILDYIRSQHMANDTPVMPYNTGIVPPQYQNPAPVLPAPTIADKYGTMHADRSFPRGKPIPIVVK